MSNEKVLNKNMVIRAATKRTEASVWPPMQCTYISNPICAVMQRSGLGMHCFGGHTLVSVLFVAVLITLFWIKPFSLLVELPDKPKQCIGSLNNYGYVQYNIVDQTKDIVHVYAHFSVKEWCALFKRFWYYITTNTLYKNTHNWHSKVMDNMDIPSISASCALAPYFKSVTAIPW